MLGYSEDDFPTYNDVWDKLVDQPKPLTDRSAWKSLIHSFIQLMVHQVWNNIRAKLEEQLAVEKERRVQGAFQARVDNRLAVIMEWYDDYLEERLTDAERSLMPNHYNARLLPSLLSLAQANDAQGSVQRKAFLALTKRMLADAEVYKTRAKRALADVVCDMPEWNPQTCDELKGLPADEVLQRYCAYFTCRAGCHGSLYTRPYLTYDEVHVHWRESHPERPWFPSDEYECEVGPLSMVASLALFPQALAARHALEAVGIPLETPQSVLDGWTREGRLFCACEHPEIPLPPEMSWSTLVSVFVSVQRSPASRGSTYNDQLANLFLLQLRHLLAHTNMRRMLESSMCVSRGREVLIHTDRFCATERNFGEGATPISTSATIIHSSRAPTAVSSSSRRARTPLRRSRARLSTTRSVRRSMRSSLRPRNRGRSPCVGYAKA